MRVWHEHTVNSRGDGSVWLWELGAGNFTHVVCIQNEQVVGLVGVGLEHERQEEAVVFAATSGLRDENWFARKRRLAFFPQLDCFGVDVHFAHLNKARSTRLS